MDNFLESARRYLEEKKDNKLKKLEAAVRKGISEKMKPTQELMAFYRCAAMEIETKFKVLDQQFSLTEDRNPIESITSRIKSIDSIIEKARRKNIPLTKEGLENNMFDIAGVRVVCAFEKDIYMLRDVLLSQDDVTLVEERDYIKNPKASGYSSLHLIVETPIFLLDEKKMMKVEIQLRTMAMDQWAALEHRLMYKKDLPEEVQAAARKKLIECSILTGQLDAIMQDVKDMTDQALLEKEKGRAQLLLE